jgi:CheY-like chemotaxis protein
MPFKVLLVEDDENFRPVALTALELAGFEVAEAADGMAALAWLAREQPDVIVADLEMPVLDGRELCARLRAEPAWAHIPVVVLSAHLESDGPDSLPGVAANYFLRKEGSFARVLDRIASLLAPHC